MEITCIDKTFGTIKVIHSDKVPRIKEKIYIDKELYLIEDVIWTPRIYGMFASSTYDIKLILEPCS